MNASQKEKRVYSLSEMLLGNAAIIIWILLGTTVFWLFSFLAAMGFAILAAFLVYYELGKKGCLSCYYCEVCTIGIGKLPDAFFSKRGTENLNRKALKLFPYVYVVLSLVPIFLISISIAQEFSTIKLGLIAGLLLFSIVTGTIRRKTLLSSQP